jgi:hypothetical protein
LNILSGFDCSQPSSSYLALLTPRGCGAASLMAAVLHLMWDTLYISSLRTLIRTSNYDSLFVRTDIKYLQGNIERQQIERVRCNEMNNENGL